MKKKKKIVYGTSLLLAFLMALGAWAYICIHPGRESVQAAQAQIKAYSHYELLQDGKQVLRFDEDTTTLAACFMNSNTLWPSCKGKLAVSYDTSLSQNAYQGKDADSILAERISLLDSTYNDAKWKVGELNYYIHSHSVADMGYNRVSAYAAQETTIKDSAKKLLDSLKHISKQKSHLKLVRRIAYRAFYRNEAGKLTSEPCKRLSTGAETKQEPTAPSTHIFQLISEKTPEGIRPICPSKAATLVTTQGATLRRAIDFTLLPDSLGYYQGTVDSLNQPHGHGIWQGYDGTFYEGHWEHGKREGFGFSIAPKKPLRLGEWKSNQYKGERLVYTSDRIYGIDISKYQHQKGRKKYAINWDRLRITHLGSISKKTVSGAVNYPIRYIYVKSTEGKSLVNPYYKKDYKSAKLHGYKVGTYHFFTTITPATEQARHFLKHSYIQRGDFPPVLDVEPLPSQIKKMGGAGVLFSRVRTWLKEVERATGVKPILYVSQTFVNKYLPLAPDLVRNYRVWIARYGEYKPDIRLVYWQLCPDGRVAGIHGEVDINVFNGYEDAYQRFVKNNAVK